MTLVVGTNTYATLAEFKTFISDRYENVLVVTAGTTNDAVISRCLVSAFDTLKKIPYNTEHLTAGEEEDTYIAAEWIKDAQCLEAVALYLIQSDEDLSNRLSLQSQGLDRVTINGLTESYGRLGKNKIAGLYSEPAWRTIKPYVVRYPTKVFTDI